MNKFSKSLLAASLAISAMSANAQGTVGELLDGGAKKMTKDQLVAYIGGTKLKGPNRTNEILMDIDLKADGSFSGNVNNPQRRIASDTSGKWDVDDAGKTCMNGRLIAWNMAFNTCFFSYRLGDVTYRTLNDSEDRATTVGKGLDPTKAN
ncbi:MAG: hypothetical protein V4542_03050 [Pseudomonadota bacterium]